jgi:PTH2 family peptidyl-tRNA hydrolase
MADPRQPTPTALLVGTAITACIFGYMLGTASSLGLLPFSKSATATKRVRSSRTGTYDDSEESSSDEIDASLLDHAPNWVNSEAADRRDGLRVEKEEKPLKKKIKGGAKKIEAVGAMEPFDGREDEECKLVLVVRTDLGMTKGEILLP